MNVQVSAKSTSASLANRICEARGWDAGKVFRHQFLITRTGRAVHASWQTRALGGWHLQHCPDLRCVELTGKSAQSGKTETLALVIGLAIDGKAGTLLSGKVKLPDATLAGIEAFLERLSGRFLALVAQDGQERAYFDPTGGVSAVFSEAEQAVTSNATLVLERDLQAPDGVSSDDVMTLKDRFYLGETSDHAFTRIFANHYLDLAQFRLVRHWPKTEIELVEAPEQLEEIGMRIQTRLRGIMAALSENLTCSFPLSAGKDSRILLSAALPVLEKIDSFYTFAINKMTRLDCHVARNIAWQYGFPHQVIARGTRAYKTAFREEELGEIRDKMALRTGYCFSGRDDGLVRALSIAPRADVTFRGNLCEITRANKYRRPFPPEGFTRDRAFHALLELTPEAAAEKIEPSRLKALRQRYWAWADSLPGTTQTRLIDYAHCEHWLPSIGNTEYYAFTRSFFVNPFNDRDLLQWTLAVDPYQRKRSRLVAQIIAAGDPALLGVPYLKQYLKIVDDARAKGVDTFKL